MKAASFQQFLQPIEETLAQVAYGQEPTNLYEPISYLMALGGKRLRPTLVLLGHQLFSPDFTTALRPAIGVEVFHNFTLMHDDIMDQAPLRRNLPTVHTKWNPNVAILSGDVMLVRAYELMMEVPDQYLRQVLTRFSQTAAEVCEGQQWDMDFESLPSVSVSQYLEMIRLKTAVLLGFSLELGAILAGADATQQATLYQVGVSAGIGFQLMDDYLDVFGQADKVGKQVGGDILANKKTWLLLKALEKAAGTPLAEELNHWLAAKEYIASEKVDAVKTIYEVLDIPTLAMEIIDSYFNQSRQLLATLSLYGEKAATVQAYFDALSKRDR